MIPQRILLGIVTAPRPEGMDYLAATVDAIVRTTQSIPIDVVVAPTFKQLGMFPAHKKDFGRNTMEVLMPLWDEFQHDVEAKTPDHRGLERNSQRLLAYLLTRAHEYGGWVMTAQDDLILCRRALDRVYQVLCWLSRYETKCGAVSFYTPRETAGKHRRALWPYPDRQFYGDLLLLWRAACARKYNAAANLFHARDLDISDFFHGETRIDGGWKLMAHSPCLVQHAGVVSATGKAWVGQRTTMNFRGEDYDAVTGAKKWE